jgi:hypothetical protein
MIANIAFQFEDKPGGINEFVSGMWFLPPTGDHTYPLGTDAQAG